MRFADIGNERRWYCATHFICPRPPKLRNPEEDIVLTQEQLDALQKEFDDWNRKHPPTTPVDLEGVLPVPKSEEELKLEADALADEQMKLIEMFSQIVERKEFPEAF